MARITKAHRKQIADAMDAHLFNEKALALQKKWEKRSLASDDGLKIYRYLVPAPLEIILRGIPAVHVAYITHIKFGGSFHPINAKIPQTRYPLPSFAKVIGQEVNLISPYYTEAASNFKYKDKDTPYLDAYHYNLKHQLDKAVERKELVLQCNEVKTEREKEMRLFRQKRDSVRDSTEQMLEYITTTKKLRDNWPEAWTICSSFLPQDGTTSVPAVVVADFQNAINEAKNFTVEAKKAELSLVANQVRENNNEHAQNHAAKNQDERTV